MTDLEQALEVLARARAAAEEIGVPMCIAVVDDGGHLVAFARMDGAKFLTVDMAIGKAWTAASAGVPGSVLGALVEQNPRAAAVFSTATDGRFLAGEGGLPLPGGGAIGVSGGTGDQDEIVAKAGLG